MGNTFNKNKVVPFENTSPIKNITKLETVDEEKIKKPKLKSNIPTNKSNNDDKYTPRYTASGALNGNSSYSISANLATVRSERRQYKRNRNKYI